LFLTLKLQRAYQPGVAVENETPNLYTQPLA